MAKAEANGNASHEQQLLDYSKACVQPAYDYFYLKFNNDLKPVLDAFKVTRLFLPFKFHELKPSATDIDCLKAFPFLSSQETIDGLKMEIPMYMAASEDVSTEIDLIAWWKRQASELPKWTNTFKKVLLVQPPSPAAERFFFNITKIYCATAVIFGDYIELSVMLQFNFARTQSKNATFQLFMFIIKLVGKSCFYFRYSHLNIVKILFKQDGKQKAK